MAAAFHAAVIYGPELFPSAPPPKRAPVVEEKLIEIAMPPEVPEQTETVEAQAEPSAATAFAPPSLVDIPPVRVDAFAQPILVPVSGLQIGRNLATVPVGRPGNGLGKGMGNLYEVGSLDKAPQARVRGEPNYPPDLKARSVTGEVEVEYIIDSHGKVCALSILRSTHPSFEISVTEALLRWSYEPGKKNGRAVNTHVHQVITFNLDRP